jgi:hypothetical protein
MIRLFAAASMLFAGMAALADDPPANEDVDVAKTTERVVEDAKEAGKRLADKDPGNDTQQIQKNIVKKLDDLLRKAHEPPSPRDGNNSSSSNNGDMGGSSKQPMGGKSTPSAQRKERRETKNGLAKENTQPKSQPSPLNERPDPQMDLGSGKPSPNKMALKGNAMPPRLPDVYKDVWGQLPEKMRREMDLYFREDFMPRYSELLRQYYSSLAESTGKNKP